jgi:hypothetical protein
MANPIAGRAGQYKRGITRPDVAPRFLVAYLVRLTGAPFRVVAAQCGYQSRSAARHAVLAFQRQAANWIGSAFELAIVDSLHAASWPAALAGDDRALDRVLRLSERRSKILKLDAAMANRRVPPTRLTIISSLAEFFRSTLEPEVLEREATRFQRTMRLAS